VVEAGSAEAVVVDAVSAEAGSAEVVSAEAGSASIWVLGLAAGVLAVACLVGVVASAVSARHRAESAADLAALAGAVAARDGQDGCREAAAVAAANRAVLNACHVGGDNSLTVVAAIALPPAVSRLVPGRATATSRAGW
jgi:secretion/DNA translocation related TadE-like protein